MLLQQSKCLVMKAWPGQGAECQSSLQVESIECMGEGEGGGASECSLEGKGSFTSVVGRNGGPYKIPQEIGEGCSSFLPSPKVLAAIDTLPYPRFLGRWLFPVLVGKGVGSWWPSSAYPTSTLSQIMNETVGRELWIPTWVMSLCTFKNTLF